MKHKTLELYFDGVYFFFKSKSELDKAKEFTKREPHKNANTMHRFLFESSIKYSANVSPNRTLRRNDGY